MAAPQSDDEIPVNFPECRDARFPRILQRRDDWHPRLPLRLRAKNLIRRVFVALWDCSPEAQRAKFDSDEKLKVPLGRKDKMADLGE